MTHSAGVRSLRLRHLASTSTGSKMKRSDTTNSTNSLPLTVRNLALSRRGSKIGPRTISDNYTETLQTSYNLVFNDINSADDQVQNATVETLASAIHDIGVDVTVHDYDYESLDTQRGVNSAGEEWETFLTSVLKCNGKPNPKKCRWVSVDNFDTRSLMQLLVAHVIPPLASKSILNLWYQQINLTEFSTHMLIILPCIRLTRRSMKSFTKYKKFTKLGSHLSQAKRLGREGIIATTSSWFEELISTTETSIAHHKSNIPEDEFFIVEVESGRAVILENNQFDEMLTLTTDWKSRNDNSSIDEDEEGGEEFADGDSDDEEEGVMADVKGPFYDQHLYIQRDFSFIRTGDSNWLLASCIRSIIEDIGPVANAFRMKLELMQDLLHDTKKSQARASLMHDFLRKIHIIQREVEWMNRKIKPMRRIVQHLIDDHRIGKDLTYYINDALNNVGDIQDELTAILSLLTVMKFEFENLQDKKMNHLLGILTLTTVCVLPAQFMTGLFGMNFVDSVGDPEPKMLSWRYGYTVFWTLSIFSTLVLYLLFKLKLQVL